MAECAMTHNMYQPFPNVPAHNRLRENIAAKAKQAYEDDREQDFAKLALILSEPELYEQAVARVGQFN